MTRTPGAARRIALAATVLTMTAALAGCGSSSSSVAPAASPGASGATSGDPAVIALTPDSVKTKGELVVGMEAQYPPFGFYDTDNKTIIGADADIAAGIAAAMGVKLTITDSAFDSIIPSLASHRFDMAQSAFTVTPDRIKQVDFVTYYYEGDGLLVKAGNPSNLAIDDTLCGVKVAVLKGSTQDLVTVPRLEKDCGTAGKPALAVTILPGSSDLALSLTSGRVEGVLTDGSNAAYTAKLSNGKMELAAGKPFNPAPFGIAAPKDTTMAKAVQAALEKMMADGSYLQILTKWGMQAGAVTGTPKINEVAAA